MPQQITFNDVQQLFAVKYEAAHDFNSFIFDELQKGNQLDAAQIGSMYLQILQFRIDDLANQDGE